MASVNDQTRLSKMKSSYTIKPDFMIIGAQKSGTTWLWRVLDEHSGTDLPRKKELHFFGGVEIYQKGYEWYYSHFSSLDPSKITGEASTTYLYNYIPYWYNRSHLIEHDHSLPTIPELITNELPNIKILIILRNPVQRAVSAYHHWMQKEEKGGISPLLGIRKTARRYPKMRILEYGFYAKYIKLWKQFIPPERMRILIFEEDVVKFPEKTVPQVYNFLGLDTSFQPESLRKYIHKSWSTTKILLHYYANPFCKKIIQSRIGKVFDNYDVLRGLIVKKNVIEYLRSMYLQDRAELERLIGRDLYCWT